MDRVSGSAERPGMRKQSERDELIRRVTQRGAPVVAIAAELGLPPSTAYRWMRELADKGGARGEALVRSEPRFVELLPASTLDARLVVEVSAAKIEVRAGFDAALLRSVVEALAGGDS
jgi:transposase-like protein